VLTICVKEGLASKIEQKQKGGTPSLLGGYSPTKKGVLPHQKGGTPPLNNSEPLAITAFERVDNL